VADIEHVFELLDLLELWNLVLNSVRVLRSAELSGVLDDSHMTPARKIPPRPAIPISTTVCELCEKKK